MSVIDHPSHYAAAGHGIYGECIDYTERLGFIRGNAFKYVWRAGFKSNAEQDLAKALWYARREIARGYTHADKPSYLLHQLEDGPLTLRRAILVGLWKCNNLDRVARLIDTALTDPEALDEEV